MSWELVLLLGLLTYGSRALALALLPRMPGPIAVVLDRMPAALFAGLAVIGLVGPGSATAPFEVYIAALGALLVTPFRSLPICLAGGVAGYLLASLLAGPLA